MQEISQITRISWHTAALVAALSALGACASGGASSTSNASSPASTAAATTSGYTDAQLEHFVAARAEITPISSGLSASATAEQRAQATSQINAALARHGLTADTYNTIGERARTDQALSNRIAGLTPANFTDAQVAAFAAAATEIDPISRSLPTATPAQQTQATTQIRAILARHSIDSATYNAIAARAQTDSALAARITAAGSAQ